MINLVMTLILLLGGQADGVHQHPGLTVQFSWTVSTGEPDGYKVLMQSGDNSAEWLEIDDVPATPGAATEEWEYTATDYQQFRIKVTAHKYVVEYDQTFTGPESVPSEWIMLIPNIGKPGAPTVIAVEFVR